MASQVSWTSRSSCQSWMDMDSFIRRFRHGSSAVKTFGGRPRLRPTGSADASRESGRDNWWPLTKENGGSPKKGLEALTRRSKWKKKKSAVPRIKQCEGDELSQLGSMPIVGQ